MKFDLLSLILVALLTWGVTYRHSHSREELYQERLKETLDHIHELEDEIKFGGGAHQHGGGMKHAPLDIAETEWRPTVALEVTKDPMAGYNVQIITENFAFSPERASRDHVEGEGHAHIYVDDIKLGRVYGPWEHISLTPGTHTVKVNLNSNNHRALLIDGKAVEAVVEVVVE